jgi:hypothetical protein
VIRRQPILALLAAETISSLGSQMSALALPWFVLIETGSATLMGVVFAVELLPMVARATCRCGYRATKLRACSERERTGLETSPITPYLAHRYVAFLRAFTFKSRSTASSLS